MPWIALLSKRRIVNYEVHTSSLFPRLQAASNAHGWSDSARTGVKTKEGSQFSPFFFLFLFQGVCLEITTRRQSAMKCTYKRSAAARKRAHMVTKRRNTVEFVVPRVRGSMHRSFRCSPRFPRDVGKKNERGARHWARFAAPWTLLSVNNAAAAAI